MSSVAILGYLSIDSLCHDSGAGSIQPGGAALYSALGALRAGGQPALHASVGPDWPQAWTDTLAALGVDVGCVVRRSEPTRRTLIRHTGRERESRHFGQEDWLAATRAHLPQLGSTTARVVLASPMPVSALAECLSRADGRPVVADTSEWVASTQGAALKTLLARLAVFAPSREETRLLCPDLDDDQAALSLAAAGPCVIQKRGAEGLVVANGTDLRRLPAVAAKVIDPTGAGDAVVGAIAAGLAQGLAPFDAARAAMAIGAMAVSGMGPSGLGFDLCSHSETEEIR